ncbi:parallel beta-helix repeat-containing protein [Fibrisoma limi BUZ 3]|uniref:Parallel beta-helix repeat-containing protein n=1 Tax=Fibrisoma limi BUZ 3 TaxID=1185876 RepID=I2GHQ0_9BACT|nr:cellulose binding domain-containing protein [Fibrisoma limi]CCH53425.1 parallel beta-helix repeat-containing protein [Fibrisoma limi BUZ 3]
MQNGYLHALRLLSLCVLLIGVCRITQGQTLSASMPFPQFNSSYISGTDITIQVNASTPTGTTVTKVEFFVQENFSGTYNKIGEDLTAPYSYIWTTPTVATARSFQIRAIVTNSASNTAVSNASTGYNSISVYAPTYVSTRNWYVSASASAANTAGTEAQPFNTIQKAADRVAPGDTVFVMGGTYTGSGINVVGIQRTGLPDKPIVFMPYKADKPVIQLGNANFNGFNVLPAAAYIQIRGFEVIGNNNAITLEQARQQPGACEGPSPTATPIARFNGNGISVSGRTGGNLRPHHVTIANNNVHDCAGAGISAIESDYITIEDNTTARTSWYTVYGTSGISVFNSWNYDTNTDQPRVIIRRNHSFGNILKIAWNIGGTGTTCRFYDGNGIILDNNRANDPNRPTVVKNPLGDYTGRFLVENNVCYLNGGRGINVNYSDNVTIINNTTYQNGQSDGPLYFGIDNELIMQGSIGCRVFNNIFYGKPGESPSSVSGSSDLQQNNNLTFSDFDNGYFTGGQNVVGQDPLFVDAANGDFRLTATSPAINAGSAVPGQYPLRDILGVERPQGAGVDIGAYEYQGSPIVFSQQPASGSAVCAGTDVSISVRVDGPVKTYQWYRESPSGQIVSLTGVTSATTATLTLPTTTTADQGAYFVVVTGFNSLTSTAFSLTVNAVPDAPNVGSLTVAQGAANVSLSATNCPGVLSWNGVEGGPTLPVSTTAVGHFVYSVTCKVGDCTSPAASVTLTVTAPPVVLSVLYRDGDNNQTGNNTIRPYFKLQNEGVSAVLYSEVTVRYWLTAEDFSPVTNLSVYWAQLGTNKVRMKYVALPQPRQGAFGYVEYSFDAAAGTLSPGSNSGEIQTGIGKQNWTNFSETDDYSFVSTAAYARNNRITVYHKGELVGGVEPSVSTPVTSLKVYAENRNSNPTTNQISTHLKLVNNGNVPLDYSQLTVRYWFSADGDKPLVHTVDYAELGNSNVRGRFVNEIRSGTDRYLELSFASSLGQLQPASSTGIIQQRINKSDWSTFNEANDFSYKPAGPLAENPSITVYLSGSLVYGQEPGPVGARVAAEGRSELRVMVLGNPVTDQYVRARVNGAEGQPLVVDLINLQGQSIQQERYGRATSQQEVVLITDMASGTYLLRISTPTETQTVKLVRQ